MDGGTEQFGQGRAAHGRIADVEVLRAIAIGMVLVQHTAGPLVPWLPWLGGPFFSRFGCWSGVDLFLAVSGFVIGRSLLPTLPPPRERRAFFNTAMSFWVRRFWRLAPSAWLWLAIPLTLSIVFNRSGVFGSVEANVRCALSALVGLANVHFAQTFLRAPGGSMLHYWSLSLEEQFYLVLPVLAFLAGKRLPFVLLAIVAAQITLKRIGAGASVLLDVTRTDALALGVLLSMWSRTAGYGRLEPRFLGVWLVRLLLPAAFVLAFAYFSRIDGEPSRYLVGGVALMASAIVWVASYDGDYLLPPGWLKRAACWMGARSYGIYLIHVPVFFATRELWFRLSPGMVQPGPHHVAILLATALPTTAILAELNYRFVEKPLRRRGARIAQRMLSRGAGATAEPAMAQPDVQTAPVQ